MLSSLTPDEAMTKLAGRIAYREHGHHPNAKEKRKWTRQYVLDELAPLRRVVDAVQRYDDNPNWNNGKKVREALTGFLRGKDDKQA